MPTENTLSSANLAPIQITAMRSRPNTNWLAVLKPRDMRASFTS